MYVFVALTTGLVFWISAWSLGVKSFDAFLVTVGLLVTAAAIYVLGPYVRRALGAEGRRPPA
jgi:hypothetical protein